MKEIDNAKEVAVEKILSSPFAKFMPEKALKYASATYKADGTVLFTLVSEAEKTYNSFNEMGYPISEEEAVDYVRKENV